MINNQYEKLLQRIVDEGEWIYNERTGKWCLTLYGGIMEYDIGKGLFPLCTTRKSPWKMAIAELLGYIRGCTNAKDFEKLGTKSWLANANDNEAWLNNPNRKGDGDMGKCYGAIAKDFGGIDLWRKVYNDLKQDIDDRGEIVTFWKPDDFDKACLRPCMFQHHFTLINGTLNLTSYQRSSDVALGTVANQVQVYTLLALMAQITGHKAGKALHINPNCHIYEDQYEVLMREGQLYRQPYGYAKLNINPDIKTLEDLETWVTLDDFEVENYEYHPAIAYPFSV